MTDPGEMKIAYCGAAGAYAFLASSQRFPGAALHGFPGFREAYRAVVDGICDAAVLPLENSTAGAVEEVQLLLDAGPLVISQTIELPIRHCLLANPGAQLSEIRTVCSHPQALRQCAGFLRTLGVSQRDAVSTASAAKALRESGSRTEAVIASGEAAALYGLTILHQDIQDCAENATRFAVITKTPAEGEQGHDHIRPRASP